MTDTDLFVLLHPQRDLFWAPILTDLLFYPSPGLGRDPAAVPTASIYGFTMRLLGAISPLATVSFQFSAEPKTAFGRSICELQLFGLSPFGFGHFSIGHISDIVDIGLPEACKASWL